MKKSATTRKITVNLPEELLKKAQDVLDKGLTETLVEGLEEILRRRQLQALRNLKGKIAFDLDLKKTRR